MKTWVVTSIVFVLGCICATNLVRLILVRPSPSNSIVRNGLIVSPAVAELGTVEQGEIQPFTFTLKNVGVGPITGIAIESSCGCILVEGANASLALGESTFTTGEFDSRRRRGPQTVNLLLRYLVDGSDHQQLLTVKADVKPRVMVHPQSVHLRLNAEDSVRHSTTFVTLAAPDHLDLEITEMTCWHPAISLSEVPASGTTDGSETVSSQLQPGSRSIQITVDHRKWQSALGTDDKHVFVSVLTNIETEPRLVIPVTVELRAERLTARKGAG